MTVLVRRGGIRSKKSEALEDFYLRLIERSENVLSPGGSRPAEPEQVRARAALFHHVRESLERPGPRHLVVAGPGEGKSYLLAGLTRDLARNALRLYRAGAVPLRELPLPIPLDLPSLAREPTPGDAADVVVTVLDQQGLLPRRLRPWLLDQIRDGRCQLLLDGLNEVAVEDKQRLVARLRQLDDLSRCGIVLAGRDGHRLSWLPTWRLLNRHKLAPLGRDGCLELIGKVFGPGERAEALRQLLGRSRLLARTCDNPLLITLLCLAHEKKKYTPTSSRGDVVNRLVRGLARHAWRAVTTEPTPASDLVDLLLPPLALTLFTHHPDLDRFPNSTLADALTRAKGRAGMQQHAETALRDELLACRILVEADEGDDDEPRYEFFRRGLYDYFTAAGLAKEANRDGWSVVAERVDRAADSPRWSDMIALLGGLLDDATPLLGLLADEARDDVFRHRLTLAARALPEIPAKSRPADPALIDRITTDGVAFWRQSQRRGTATAVGHIGRALPPLAGLSGGAEGQSARAWLTANAGSPDLAGPEDHSAGPPARGAIVILRQNSPGEVCRWLELLLTGPSEEVRHEAARALVGGDRAASDQLCRLLPDLLRHEDREVRQAAAVAAGGLSAAGVRFRSREGAPWVVSSSAGPEQVPPGHPLLRRLADLLRGMTRVLNPFR